MPDIGDIVTYYTLDSWDTNHRAIDFPAIVMAEGPEEDSLILKVFQPGVAPFDATVSPWGEVRVDAAGNPVGGGSYWRDAGSEPPDFASDIEAARPEPKDPESAYDREVRELEDRQEAERVASSKPDTLKAKHAQERRNIDERYGKLDDKSPRVDLQSGNAPQSGQPTRPLLGPDHPPPQTPPKIGDSLPKIL